MNSVSGCVPKMQCVEVCTKWPGGGSLPILWSVSGRGCGYVAVFLKEPNSLKGPIRILEKSTSKTDRALYDMGPWHGSGALLL